MSPLATCRKDGWFASVSLVGAVTLTASASPSSSRSVAADRPRRLRLALSLRDQAAADGFLAMLVAAALGRRVLNTVARVPALTPSGALRVVAEFSWLRQGGS